MPSTLTIRVFTSIALICGFAFGASGQHRIEADETPLPTPFNTYPRTRGLERFARAHLDGPHSPAVKDDLVFTCTWSLREDATVGSRLVVSSSGEVFAGYYSLYPDEVRSPSSQRLSAKQTAELAKLASTLPPSNVRPGVTRMVIVSRYYDNEWETDLYDVSDLPDGLDELLAMVGITLPYCCVEQPKKKEDATARPN